MAHLKNIRQFHLTFKSRTHEIGYTPGSQLPESKSYTASGELAMLDKSRQRGDQLPETKGYPVGDEPLKGFHLDLSWSHYRTLMKVENEHSRSFYELEAARNGWAVRQLERQIHSFYY